MMKLAWHLSFTQKLMTNDCRKMSNGQRDGCLWIPKTIRFIKRSNDYLDHLR